MNSNLFFEGPVRSGKSTILRQALLPILPQLGGFVVQRLLESDGTPVAYRLISMDEIHRLETESESQFLAVDAFYASIDSNVEPGIFLWTNPRRVNLKVFETTGIKCLQTSNQAKLILLDEIGGVDLLSPLFREAFLTLLQGHIPCIGIIKETEKARDAQLFNQEFRALLDVQTLSSGDLTKAPALVQSFLDAVKV